MASLQKTYTNDLSTSIAKQLWIARNIASAAKQDAVEFAEQEGFDPMFRRGEFFSRALQMRATSRLPRRFQRQMPQYDKSNFSYFARGQSTPFASPVGPFKTNAQTMNRLAGQPFPWLAVGSPLKYQQSQSSATVSNTPKVPKAPGINNTAKREKGVVVKDQQLGNFLAAVALSLSSSLNSINKKLDDTSEGVIAAKDGIADTHKKLEHHSESLESKLDDIIDALRFANQREKELKDQREFQAKKSEEKKATDLSNANAVIMNDMDRQEIRDMQAEDLAEDDRGPIGDPWDEPDEKQLSIPSLAEGGIVSGPDSGYLAVLHGDEYIVPDDNNWTQGQPSAVGKHSIGNMPFMAERGLVPGSHPGDNPKSMTPTFSPSSNITKTINSKTTSGDTNVYENLSEAMQLPSKAAGLMTVGIINKVLQKSTFGSEVGSRITKVIEPIAAAFGVSSASLSGLEQGMEARSKADKARSDVLTRDQSRETEKKNVFQKFSSWITGQGGHGASVGRSGSIGSTSYNRTSSININKPVAKGGGGGIIESIRNWFGLAKDKDHEVSPDTIMGNTINNMQNWRRRNEQYMELLNQSSNSSEFFTKNVAYNNVYDYKNFESSHGLTTIAQRVNDQSIEDEIMAMTGTSKPDMNIINNSTTATKRPDIVHSPLAVRGNPWEDGTYTGAYEGFA